jgi:hypothetical protein
MTETVEKLAPVRPATRRDGEIAPSTTRRTPLSPETPENRPAPPPPHQRKGTILDVVA